jgi:hypothetical protein
MGNAQQFGFGAEKPFVYGGQGVEEVDDHIGLQVAHDPVNGHDAPQEQGEASEVLEKRPPGADTPPLRIQPEIGTLKCLDGTTHAFTKEVRNAPGAALAHQDTAQLVTVSD